MRGRRARTSALASLLILLPGLAALAPSPVVAQEAGGGDTLHIDTPYRWIQRSFRVGLIGGYVSAERGVSELGPGPTVTVGARARGRISSPLSLEGGVIYGSSERHVIDPRLEEGPAPVDTVPSRWLLVEAAMQFAVTGARTWHGLQPYALIGGGFMVGIDEPTSPELEPPEPGDAPVRADIGIAPAVQAGLGVEWKVAERVGIGFEFRDQLWRITTPDAFFEPEVLDRIEDRGLPAPQDTDWTHNLSFSVGVWHYF